MSDPQRPDDRPTERLGASDADPTQQIPAWSSDSDETRSAPAWEAEVPPRAPAGQPTRAYAAGPQEEEEPQSSGRGQKIAIGVFSAIFGFVLAVVVVALGTSDTGPTDADAVAAQERIDTLESELADRDARIGELEAQLAEAQAAEGESEADIAAQREAQDERASALDDRATALDEREAALDEREAALDEREAAVAQRERDADAGPDPETDPPDADDEDGPSLPEVDEEAVQNIIDRVLEQIRNLFD